MPHEIIMPALGMSQDTGTLLAWHKVEGDTVLQGEILFEVETDKTTMEVEAPADGFLVNVSAEAGAEVPVGQVIAYINESADAVQSVTTNQLDAASIDETAAQEPSLPEGSTVIMPTLGMSQDTGLLVSWAKQPGDAVAADDVLFEVETDKSVVEVPAGHDGFLTARLAAEGDAVPTGEVIAIISNEQVANPIDRAYLAGNEAPVVAVPAQDPVEVSEVPSVEAVSTKPQPNITVPTGRVLASPKMRRLAHIAGLDLNKLAATGHPQPFHAGDYPALESANRTPVESATQRVGPVHRLVASVNAASINDLVNWLAEKGLDISMSQVLACFAGSAFGIGRAVRIESLLGGTTYVSSPQLSDVLATDEDAELLVRDLRDAFIHETHFSHEPIPVMALTSDDKGLAITLTYSDGQLSSADACQLLNDFAGRLHDPIRHLF